MNLSSSYEKQQEENPEGAAGGETPTERVRQDRRTEKKSNIENGQVVADAENARPHFCCSDSPFSILDFFSVLFFWLDVSVGCVLAGKVRILFFIYFSGTFFSILIVKKADLLIGQLQKRGKYEKIHQKYVVFDGFMILEICEQIVRER